MAEEIVKILLVEDKASDARLVERQLALTGGNRFQLLKAKLLAEGIDLIARERPDLVLLDLSLPDSEGLDGVFRACNTAPKTPVIVLTGHDDEELAVEAVRRGAQEYLVKGDVSEGSLARAVRCAIERHKAFESLRTLSLLDELTGLYNRRGFAVLADQQRMLADRTKTGFFVFYADVDGMKQVNDTFGHQAGDQVLVAAAGTLRTAFRASDIIARVGGDEFAVLAIGASSDSAPIVETRLRREFALGNVGSAAEPELSVSVGYARYDPAEPRSIDELVVEADKAMYANKKARHGS